MVISYDESLNKWHVIGTYGHGYYDTKKEAKEGYEKLKKKFRENEINRLNGVYGR